jgi:anthranilate phosphoribosyltransferase
LAGGDAASNAEALIALLENRMPNAPYEQAVLLNAAFALEVAEAAAGDAEGWNAALEALRSGRAKKALDALIELSRQSP